MSARRLHPDVDAACIPKCNADRLQKTTTREARRDASARAAASAQSYTPQAAVPFVSGTLWIVYAAGRTTIRTVPDTFFGQSPAEPLTASAASLHAPGLRTRR